MQNLSERLSHLKKEAELKFIRSPGPGGQNVNKTNSAAQLRWSLANTRCLTENEKQICYTKLINQLTKEDEIVLKCSEFRDQEQNAKAAFDRLSKIIQAALFVPKKRLKTKPTYSSKLRRLSAKKINSDKKKSRKDFE
jgi:ribosome-associated protein